MEDFIRFLQAVATHWFWITVAVIALLVNAVMDFDTKGKITLIVVAIGCLVLAVYLALNDQYRAFSEYLSG
jgi:hypothetical protein